MSPTKNNDTLSKGGRQNNSVGDVGAADGNNESVTNNSNMAEEDGSMTVGTSTTHTTSNVNENGESAARSDADDIHEDEDDAALQNKHGHNNSSTHDAPLSAINNESGSAEEHTEQRRPETGRASEALSGDSNISSYATNIDHYDITGAAASRISGTSISSGGSWMSRQFADMNTEATPPGTRTRSTTRPIRPTGGMLGIGNASTGTAAMSTTNRRPRSSSNDQNSTKCAPKDEIAKAQEEALAMSSFKRLRAEGTHTATGGSTCSSNEAIGSMRGDASTILSSSSIISAVSAPGSTSEGSSTNMSSLTSPTFQSINGDDGQTFRTRSRSRSNDMLPTIPSDCDSDDDNVDADGTSRADTSVFNERAAAAIRRSIRETPGAFHVTPIYAGEDAADSSTVEDIMGTGTSTSTVTFGSSNSSSNRNSNNVDSGEYPPESRERAPSRRRSGSRRTLSSSRATMSSNESWDLSIELAEAWVVEENGGGGGGLGGGEVVPPNTSTQPAGHSDSSSASPGIDASVEPAVVTVTATPLKEQSWFKTPSGIVLLILLFGGIVALAVAIPARKASNVSNAAAAATASRPFEIVIPSMPQDVSGMLEFKYNKVVEGKPIPMAFSADLSLHASSRIDEWYGQLKVVQYDANSTSWKVAAEYDEEEARKDEFKNDIQHGNSPGDNFGAWVDMSYDGRILAVGLPRDDPSNVPDAGSVRVMKMGMSLEESDRNDGVQHPWNLKGHGDFIVGVDPFSWTGSTFSLTADGSMIAVASPIASKGRGNVMVYKFEADDANGNGGSWFKIGQTITGDGFGSVLSFAKLTEDGTILGAGSFLNGDDESGQLRIFRWDDVANLWVQIGSTFEGNDRARLGVFPHFSRDGRTVAFSQTGEPHRCHVYQWDEVNKDWERIDDDRVFKDSYICMDLSPDGKKVILCSTDEGRCILNLLHSSGEWHEVQVFPKVDGFMPYHFEREGEGDKIAGIVAPIGNEKGYTIGFYKIN